MGNNLFLPADVEYYINSLTRETPVQQKLRQETALLPNALLQITPDEAALLAFLVKVTDAKHIIEIGTFTGYSALAMALALPDNGTLITCEIFDNWADICHRYWQEAEVDHKISLKIGLANDTLQALLNEGKAGSFDMAFVDGDKKSYDNYYELCLTLIKHGGIIVFDNMLWSGTVADEHNMEERCVALRALNLKIHTDARVDCSLLTVSDGIMLVRKR